MEIFLQRYVFLLLFIMGLGAVSLHAQEKEASKAKQPFIQKGAFLTGFSFGFTNASAREYNQDFPREITVLSMQLDGLYFVNDHFGVGPLLGYQFIYRDLVPYYRNAPDIDDRTGQLQFGAEAGYYLPLSEIFGGSSRINFFVNGGVSWLRIKFKQENQANLKPVYLFGFQVGPGFLFPVGKHIALQVKLALQARRNKYILHNYKMINGRYKIVSSTEVHKWPKQIGISFGLRVKF